MLGVLSAAGIAAGAYVQKTVSGCPCKGDCRTSPGVAACHKDACDWCTIDAECGSRMIPNRTHWDYCTYAPDESFQRKTAQEKISDLWKLITANQTRGGKYPASGSYAVMNQSLIEVVANSRDLMPAGRVKMRHSVGSICKINWSIHSASPFTGLFSAGAHNEGFLRLSTQMGVDSPDGVIPGLGLKFPRTGQTSGDTVALTSTKSHYWNFFEYNHSNHHLPHVNATAPTHHKAYEALEDHFRTSSQCSAQVGLSSMARFSQDGGEARHVEFPFKLFLVPTIETRGLSRDMPKTIYELAEEHRNIPIGTSLFTIYACGEPSANELNPTDGGIESVCAKPTNLGDLRTQSKCVPSDFGDQQMQIGHQRIEDDWKRRPEWLDQYQVASACKATSKPTPDGAPQLCGMREDEPFDASEPTESALQQSTVIIAV